MPLVNSLSSDGIRLFWLKSANSSFMRKALTERRSAISTGSPNSGIEDPDNARTYLKVVISERGFHEAHDRAVQIVDIFRGLINVFNNQNRYVGALSSLEKRHAVNRFRIGPFRTLHNLDGSLATPIYWYEPRWSHDLKSPSFAGGPHAQRQNIRSWWEKIDRNPSGILFTTASPCTAGRWMVMNLTKPYWASGLA